MNRQPTTIMNTQEKITSLIEDSKNAILAGVLIKNVKRGLTNSGMADELAIKICKIAEFEANEFKQLKAK